MVFEKSIQFYHSANNRKCTHIYFFWHEALHASSLMVFNESIRKMLIIKTLFHKNIITSIIQMQYVENMAKYMSTRLPSLWWFLQLFLGRVSWGQVAKAEGPHCVCTASDGYALQWITATQEFEKQNQKEKTSLILFQTTCWQIFQSQSLRNPENARPENNTVAFNLPSLFSLFGDAPSHQNWTAKRDILTNKTGISAVFTLGTTALCHACWA